MADTAIALDLPPGAAARVLRRRSSGQLLTLDLAREIGVGGEARVLDVPGEPRLVAKLYHQPTLERARKLGIMLEKPPALDAGASVAWPVDLLTGPSGGHFAGFLMPRAEGPRVFEFYNPTSRRRTAPLFDYRMLHRAGMNLAAAFEGLHAHGYVVGDVNESNILVSPDDGAVTLVDADSFQVRDGARTIFRSRVGKAEYTPPELQGSNFGDVDRAEEHDRFGLAVLLFLLLNEGTHPFACRLGDGQEVPPVETRISRGLFPHARTDGACRPPRMAPAFGSLDTALRVLFLRAFVKGHDDPAARPSPAEWRAALTEAEARLAACPANPRHHHAPHLDACPWCHRARLLGGRDPFPQTAALARQQDPASAVAIVPPRRPYGATPRPFAAPQPRGAATPAVATPFAPAAPAPPSRGIFAPVLAVMPPALQPAFGPAAFGNPLVWMPPAALTCLFAPTGGLRIVGLAIFFLALRHIFSAGMPKLRAATILCATVLLVLWGMGAAGISGGFANHPDPALTHNALDPYVEHVPPPVAPQAAPPGGFDVTPVTAPGDPSVPGMPDVAPTLLNADEAATRTAEVYPPEMRAAGQKGHVQARFRILPNGEPDMESFSVDWSTAGSFDEPARKVVAVLRFEPAQYAGKPEAVWVTMPIDFQP